MRYSSLKEVKLTQNQEVNRSLLTLVLEKFKLMTRERGTYSIIFKRELFLHTLYRVFDVSIKGAFLDITRLEFDVVSDLEKVLKDISYTVKVGSHELNLTSVRDANLIAALIAEKLSWDGKFLTELGLTGMLAVSKNIEMNDNCFAI
jgi:hypothetical protein